MSPDQLAFLNELRQQWDSNFVATILVARLNHDRISPEVGGVAQQMQANFHADQNIDDVVNLAMGSMGFFGGGQRGFGISYDPNEFMFYAAMGMIVAHRGNPPAVSALREQARKIVTGEADPFTVFDVAGQNMPGLGNVFRSILPLAGEFAPMIRGWALFMAALAVPAEEVPGLLGMSEEQCYKDAMKAAGVAVQAGNFDQAYEHLRTALEAAGRTPGIEDDIETITTIMVFGMIGKLKPENLRLVVEALGRLSGDRRNTDKVAALLCTAAPLLYNYGLIKDLGDQLVLIGKSLLETVSKDGRLNLSLALATTLTNLGDTTGADDLISDVKRKVEPSPDERLRIAQAEADIYWANGDVNGAADIAITALNEAEQAGAEMRIAVLQKLISLWPAKREGLDPWLLQLQNEAAQLEEPQASIMRLTAGLALFKSGKAEQGHRLIAGVDLGMVEKQAPALEPMVQQVREGLKAFKL